MDVWCPQPYFVDKSKVIKAFLRSRHKINLIAAPQGFLKSSNMRLIATFIDGLSPPAVVKRRKAIWSEIGLKIMKENDIVDAFCGQWPYIHLAFPLCGPSCAINSMVTLIRDQFERHKEILSNDRLTPVQRVVFKIYQDYNCAGERKIADGLAMLCEMLHTCHGKPVFVFIDNYDFPLLEALAKEKPMSNVQPFLAKMLFSLYSSKSVKKVLLNSISSFTAATDETTVKVYRFLHVHKYTKYYGFVEKDVMMLASTNRCSFEITKQILSRHYTTIDGKHKIFSPEWLLDFLKHDLIESPIWFEEILHKEAMTTVSVRRRLAQLEQGKCVKAKVTQFCSYTDLLQLNRLLNGRVTDMEEDEAELVMRLLFEFGLFTPVEVTSASSTLACHCMSLELTKFRLIDTSRMTASLKTVSL